MHCPCDILLLSWFSNILSCKFVKQNELKDKASIDENKVDTETLSGMKNTGAGCTKG